MTSNTSITSYRKFGYTSMKEPSDVTSLVLELMLDNSACRKRLNDYTEGLLVQTAHKMESFKAAYEASKQGKKESKGGFTPRRF